MKKITLLSILFLSLSSFSIFKPSNRSLLSIKKTKYFLQEDENIQKGKQIFIKNQCTLCHKEKTEGLAPALSVINSFYKGDKDKLIKFLKRESDPIVMPESFGIMAANLFKTKRMSDEDLNALASYMLSIK